MYRSVLLIGITVCLNMGCEAHKDWRYTQSNDESLLAPSDADMGVSHPNTDATGRHDLSVTPTSGRFPAAMAVVQVAAIEGADSPSGLRIVNMATERASFWNDQMSSIDAIREITVMHAQSSDPRGTNYHELLKEAARLKCTLCFMFARVPADDSRADAEFRGVLWDAVAVTPVASYCTTHDVESVKMVHDKNDPKHGISRRTCEAEIRAEAKLRRMVCETLWDMVARDSRSTTTQPSPWRGEHSLFPRNGDERAYEILRHLNSKR